MVSPRDPHDPQGILETLRDHLAKIDRKIDGLSDNLNGKIDGLSNKYDKLNGKIDGMKNDLDMIKGAHATNETVRKPARVADGLGYQFVYELPEATLLEYGRQARDKGKDKNEVESFKNADLVMMVQDTEHHPHYLAVEASYTVGADDIRRAKRTADYLQELTGILSVPVVAGVELMPGLEGRMDNGEVRWYQIPKGDLQPR